MKTNWPTKKLGECLMQFDRGISWSRKDEGGTVAVLRIPNIEEGHINLNDLKYIDPKNGSGELDKNDIVMVASNGNPDLVGRSALVTEKEKGMRFASFLVRLRIDNTRLLSHYAHLFLLTPTFKRELRRKIATTSGIYNLRKEHVEKIKIPLPPLAIQKQIVERLDKIAEAQKLNDDLIQKTDELFQSLLHKELNPIRDSKHSNGVNPSGRNWGEKELGEIASLVRGPFGGSLRKDIFVQSGDCVYEQGNVIDNDLENFRYFVTPEKFEQMKRFEVLADDILMSCSGTIGKFVKIPKNFKKGIINQALLKITPNQNVVGEFLKLTLEKYFASNSYHVKGIAIKNIAAVKELKKIKIPLPPLKLQKQIVAKLSAVQNYKKQLLGQKSKLQELFDSALAKSMTSEKKSKDD